MKMILFWRFVFGKHDDEDNNRRNVEDKPDGGDGRGCCDTEGTKDKTNEETTRNADTKG